MESGGDSEHDQQQQPSRKGGSGDEKERGGYDLTAGYAEADAVRKPVTGELGGGGRSQKDEKSLDQQPGSQNRSQDGESAHFQATFSSLVNPLREADGWRSRRDPAGRSA